MVSKSKQNKNSLIHLYKCKFVYWQKEKWKNGIFTAKLNILCYDQIAHISAKEWQDCHSKKHLKRWKGNPNHEKNPNITLFEGLGQELTAACRPRGDAQDHFLISLNCIPYFLVLQYQKKAKKCKNVKSSGVASGSNAVSYMSFVGAVITLVLNINNNINGVSFELSGLQLRYRTQYLLRRGGACGLGWVSRFVAHWRRVCTGNVTNVQVLTKKLKVHISTSFWSTQHPNACQNIQQVWFIYGYLIL